MVKITKKQFKKKFLKLVDAAIDKHLPEEGTDLEFEIIAHRALCNQCGHALSALRKGAK